MNFDAQPRFFPPPRQAHPEGILALGGRLDPEWLLDAYAHGIFPWPIDDRHPLAWWSPDPRAVLPLDAFHVPRRLQRTCRTGRFEVTVDQDFAGVIDGCATAGDRVGETWITPAMRDAYIRLHQLGHAHGVEAWREGRLVGGIYGVAIGGAFSAESMFHRQRDAGKVALVHLVQRLIAAGYRLLDVQQQTDHIAQFGAIELPRVEYLARLAEAIRVRVGSLVYSL